MKGRRVWTHVIKTWTISGHTKFRIQQKLPSPRFPCWPLCTPRTSKVTEKQFLPYSLLTPVLLPMESSCFYCLCVSKSRNFLLTQLHLQCLECTSSDAPPVHLQCLAPPVSGLEAVNQTHICSEWSSDRQRGCRRRAAPCGHSVAGLLTGSYLLWDRSEGHGVGHEWITKSQPLGFIHVLHGDTKH